MQNAAAADSTLDLVGWNWNSASDLIIYNKPVISYPLFISFRLQRIDLIYNIYVSVKSLFAYTDNQRPKLFFTFLNSW